MSPTKTAMTEQAGEGKRDEDAALVPLLLLMIVVTARRDPTRADGGVGAGRRSGRPDHRTALAKAGVGVAPVDVERQVTLPVALGRPMSWGTDTGLAAGPTGCYASLEVQSLLADQSRHRCVPLPDLLVAAALKRTHRAALRR